MANVVSLASSTSPPDEFVEALNGLAVGTVSLEAVRRALAVALEADEGAVATMRPVLDNAYLDGRLAAEHYEILSRDIGHEAGDDAPTEWSEEVVNEAAPASDTAPPAGAASGTAPGGTGRAGLNPGAVLRNRFVLQSRLKASAMSEIYKVLDRRRQEAGAANPWLAIKLVSPANGRFPEALRLLQQEAVLAQQLEHPNIVRVFDFDRDGEHAFITMEWLDGESLAELLTRQHYRPITIARARQIMSEVGSALEFAHARGIVHADVKPGNIFLTRDGTARLLDFGIARYTADGADRVATAARTPAYASCEVLEGEPPTPQDDVYAAACVAYRMLAGRRAFGHHDALAAEAAGRKPAAVRGLSQPQWSALERALAFRRAARTPDMATFLREFNSPAPQPQVPAAAEQAHAAAPSRAPARSGLAWAGLAAGLAAIAFFAWHAPAGDSAANAAAVPESADLASVTAAGPVYTDVMPAASPGPATMPDTATDTPLPQGGSVVQAPIAPAPPGPLTVPLSDLRFTRYVEPTDRHPSGSRNPVGWVELSFIVGADGRTRDITIVDASPPERYEDAALAAVRRWRFEPALAEGRAVDRRTGVRLRFQPK